MEPKRQYQPEDDESRAEPSKRRREDSQQSETWRTITMFRSLVHLRNDIQPYLVDLVQNLVQDEFDRQLPLRLNNNQNGIPEPKSFQLVFKNELPATYFTFSKIKAKDDTLVEIALYDIRSQSVVTDGPLSSIKIEICVLNGEFGSNGNEDWTTDEFKAKILPPRDNKGQLLRGDKVVTTENGVGYINNIVFTDNSCWTRNRHFRLGAKVVSSNLNEGNIREGRSEPFMVKDCRVERNQKHYPPSPNDEIWRLTDISKDGKIHKRLSSHEIYNVKDLLQLHETNPSSLKQKIGKISAKRLEKIIKHAQTSVAKPTFDGLNYHSRSTLNSDNKQLVDAYRNIQEVSTPVDQTSIHNLPDPFTSLQSAGQFPDLQAQLPTSQLEGAEKEQDFSEPCTSAAHNSQPGFEFDDLILQTYMEELDYV